MPLVVRGGKLIIGSDGKLTTNQDCCCEPDCDLCQLAGDHVCPCIDTVKPNDTKNFGDVEVTILNNSVAMPYTGIFAPCDEACPEIEGTYVVGCGSGIVTIFNKTVIICENESYSILAELSWNSNEVMLQIVSSYGSEGFGTGLRQTKTWLWDRTGTLTGYDVIITEDCPVECANEQQYKDCSAGTHSWDSISVTPSSIDENGCELKDVEATMQILAPTA